MNDLPVREVATAMRGTQGSLAVLLRGVAGAIVGGAVGIFVFQLLARQGLYGIMIPGAILGLGAGLVARGRSIPLGVACALAALALAIFAEWTMFPFAKDKSLGFFIAHVHELPAMKLVMIGIGALFAFWFGVGR
jgi:hypothetical protein